MGDIDRNAAEEAFKFFDRDEDGKITSDEFMQMVQSLGETPTQPEFTEMLSSFPADNLDWEQVVSLFPKIVASRKTQGEIIEAFQVFDHRSNGHISVSDFEQMLVGDGVDASEVASAVEAAQVVAKGT